MSAEVNQQLSKALRRSKIVFMASVCVWAGLVGINNVMDYRANFQFVQHVLEMDTTFPGNPLLWRSLRWGPLQHAAYLGIIAVELLVGLLSGIAVFRCSPPEMMPIDSHAPRRSASWHSRSACYCGWRGLRLSVESISSCGSRLPGTARKPRSDSPCCACWDSCFWRSMNESRICGVPGFRRRQAGALEGTPTWRAHCTRMLSFRL